MGTISADAPGLHDQHRWKTLAIWTGEGYYLLQTEDTGDVPVRLFLTPALLEEVEDLLYQQIVNATRFPGVRLVVITPDAHYGYGVPVGSVILTDLARGAIAMGPVGFDIGCFVAETLVPTTDGHTSPISELAASGQDIWIYALSPAHQVVPAQARAKRTRAQASLVRLVLDTGGELLCTPDHLFMLRDGSYRQVESLTPGTALMPFSQCREQDGDAGVRHDAHQTVASLESVDWVADVYCLTVPEYGNFALDAGVFVHNCGMMSARSEVPAEAATYDQRLAFNRAVMRRVEMGVGGKRKQHRLGTLAEPEFERLVRGGAEYYVRHYGATFDRSHAERHRIPVDETWHIPWGGKGKPERGIAELGSLGGGNHFIELQRCEQTGTLFVQVHTGSRGFGHGLATNYFELARAERPREIIHLDLGYFLPNSPHYQGYLNAVAAGGNYAILNRLIIYEQVAEAFREVFQAGLELIYEISHNLVQREWHPDFGDIWVHRKGATRAFPGGHPALAGTEWETLGHPVLIPGSNKDESFILRPEPGAVKSAYSVNHGAGRRMSRSAALRELSQQEIDRQYRAAGIPVNVEAPVPLDEAAPCYKSAKEVVEAVVGAGLARVEYTLWPLSSLKGTETRRRVRHRQKAPAP
jgi:tRNA-splicing ligase RtcB